jgi:uncharacterized protein YeeX (DUF496 family)
MESIKQVLMRRDGMTSQEADDLIAEAREDFNERVDYGDFSVMDDFCSEWFGLEPDYLEEFIS